MDSFTITLLFWIIGGLSIILVIGEIMLLFSLWEIQDNSDRLLSNHNLRLIELEKIHEKELKKLGESNDR